MSSLSTLPKGDSAWLLRKAVERIMQQVSVLETNIGSSTTGNSANTQIIFNDNGTLRGDAGLTYNAATDTLTAGSATITGDLTVRTNQLIVNSSGVGVGTTPSAWSGIGPAIQVEQASLLSESSNQLYLTANGYFAGGQWNYINNASADQYYQIAGSHVWRNGTGGSPGTAIGWSTLMTLNSTGLGVGVSPLGKLHIRQSGAGIQEVGYFENNQAAAADVGARVSLLGTGSVAMATVESAWNGAASTDAYLSFRTRGSGSVVERLRIDSSGNVGIGVTPSYLLHTAVASGANRNIARFQVTGASNGLTITWNHATTKMIVNLSNLPTSSAGLASGDLWIDTSAGNTLKVA